MHGHHGRDASHNQRRSHPGKRIEPPLLRQPGSLTRIENDQAQGWQVAQQDAQSWPVDGTGLPRFILHEQHATAGALVKVAVAHIMHDVVGVLGQPVAQALGGGSRQELDLDALQPGPGALDQRAFPGQIETRTVYRLGQDDQDAQGWVQGERGMGPRHIEVAHDGRVTRQVEPVAGLSAVQELPGKTGQLGQAGICGVDVDLDAQAGIRAVYPAQAPVEQGADGTGKQRSKELAAQLLG